MDPWINRTSAAPGRYGTGPMRKRNRGQGLKIRAGKIPVHRTEASTPAWQTERHTGLKRRQREVQTILLPQRRAGAPPSAGSPWPESEQRQRLSSAGTRGEPGSRYPGGAPCLTAFPSSRITAEHPRSIRDTRMQTPPRVQGSFSACSLRSGDLRPELGKISVL